MEYLICNITTSNDTELKKYFIDNILKMTAYNSVVSDNLTKKNYYYFVLIPYEEGIIDDNVIIASSIINNSIDRFASNKININQLNSITKFFMKGIKNIKSYIKMSPNTAVVHFFNNYKINIDIIQKINSDAFNVFYTDGSSESSRGIAGWSSIKLKERSENGIYDNFNNDKYEYEVFYGHICDGTNNIGELNGLKTSIENFGDKQFQLIISDSIYTIKCFREWYQSWYKNNFIGSQHREIMNRTLIEEIGNKLKESDKIVLFQWTKGHNSNPFNELADEMAKRGKENI